MKKKRNREIPLQTKARNHLIYYKKKKKNKRFGIFVGCGTTDNVENVNSISPLEMLYYYQIIQSIYSKTTSRMSWKGKRVLWHSQRFYSRNDKLYNLVWKINKNLWTKKENIAYENIWNRKVKWERQNVVNFSELHRVCVIL